MVILTTAVYFQSSSAHEYSRRKVHLDDHVRSLCFPPYPPDPVGPCNDIFALHQLVDTPIVPRQLFVTSHPVNEAMASATQPCHAVKPPFLVPAPLASFGMDLLWDQMVIGEWDPVTVTDLAGGSTSGRPDRRSGCCGIDIFLEDWYEEPWEIGLRVE